MQEGDETQREKDGREKPQDEETKARLEAMVTPEQVLSASVARKRRSVARKRSASANRTREQTPCRECISSSSSDGVRNETKIPDRPRRKPLRSSSERVQKKKDETSTDVASTGFCLCCLELLCFFFF